MKTIEQLLKLSQNPYYAMTANEKKMLDDFLDKKQDSDSKTSPKKSSRESPRRTRVTVKNVVKKADTYPPQADESSQSDQTAEDK